jgi:hypothetical protein
MILKCATTTAAAVVLAAVTPAATVAAPSSGGAGTALNFNVNTTVPPVSGRIPSSLAFAATGFEFDPRAVAKRCSHEQAQLDECPSGALIGVGKLVVHVVTTTFTRTTTFPLNMYLRTNTAVLGVAFIGGPKVVPGTLTTAGGVALSFNPLPKPPRFPGVTLSLEQVTINLGASRTVVTRERKKDPRTHKEYTVVTRTHYDLIHAPAACSGGWTSSVTLGFPSGPSASFTSPIACAAGQATTWRAT